MIPPTAKAQIDAICAREEVALRDLMGSHLSEQHLVAARHRIWEALRAERDEHDRPVYTLARIARWFDVRHSAVSQALRP